MPLTKIQAERLHQVISTTKITAESSNQDRAKWDEAMSGAPVWNQKIAGDTPHDNLQKELIACRKQSLDRKTVVVDVDGTKVRVYPPSDANIVSEVDDVFARGIDSARAVTEILKNIPTHSMELMLHAEDPALKELTRLLNKFQSNMNIHRNNPNEAEGMENARKELARFNGALADLLVTRGAVEKRGEAIQAINFVRDFLWKKDICMPMCVIEDNDTTQMLRYAEPMEFGPVEFARKDPKTGKTIDPWDGAQPWKAKLAKAVGGGKETPGWFESFMGTNLETMKTLSSTPMSRFTPNPANAFDCSDIIVDKASNEVTHISHHERVAVSEPLNVGATKSRQDITDLNHFQLMSNKKLKDGLNSFMEKWGPIIGDDPIPYTMLHQTLIGDEVTFSPDQSKAKASRVQASVIDSKTEANAAVREVLENSTIYRDKLTGDITVKSNKEFNEPPLNGKIPDGCQKVNVDLLETNNGINMWSARTRVRNNDYNDARQLIGNAVNMFNKVQTKYPDNKDLKTVTDFLNSRDHSLVTPFKFRGKDVKAAVENLTKELRKEDGQFRDLPKITRENLALSVQAAVELKCTVHETWLGSARRNIANFTRDYVRQVPILGNLVDWAVRGAMTVAATGLKAIAGLLTLPFTLPQWIKHRGDRREMYKSTYEGILAESLGTLKGGCMSSADRAGEVGEQRAAMKKQFAEEGRILSYNDSPTEKGRVYAEYGSTKVKHDIVEMATGTPGTSDDETRGIFLNARAGVLSHVAETAAEQRLAKDLSGLRKGKYSEVTAEQYLSSPAVGEKAPKGEIQQVPLKGASLRTPLLNEQSVGAKREGAKDDIGVGSSTVSKDDSEKSLIM